MSAIGATGALVVSYPVVAVVPAVPEEVVPCSFSRPLVPVTSVVVDLSPVAKAVRAAANFPTDVPDCAVAGVAEVDVSYEWALSREPPSVLPTLYSASVLAVLEALCQLYILPTRIAQPGERTRNCLCRGRDEGSCL